MSIKSEFVSALGVLTGFFTSFVSAFKNRGGIDEQLHELLVGRKSEEFIAGVVKLALEMTGVVRDGLCIVVDYSRSLAEMIKAGAYDWVNSDITSKHFPVKGTGRIELILELVHYDKLMSSDDIVQDMDQCGLRPATLPELLAYGEKNPGEQRKYPIVELASVWRLWFSRRCVASLHCHDSKRKLSLHFWEGDWYGDYRFLAFRK